MRFPILKIATFHPIDSQIKIIVSTIVLHNIISLYISGEEWLSRQLNNIDPSVITQVSDDDEEYSEDIESMNNLWQTDNVKREAIAMQMRNDYRNIRNRKTMA